MAGSRSSFPLRSPLLGLLAAIAVVTVLALARKALVPLALAVLVAFVLTPAAEALERRWLSRAASVALVMTLALGAVGGFGYVLSRQFADLSARLTAYSGSMRAKIAALRGTGTGTIESLRKTVEEVSTALDETVKKDRGVQSVRVVPSEPTAAERLRGTIGPVVEPLATGGFVVVLVAFMLSQREDLRNRLIRLVGQGRLTLATRTLDEVGRRISRFLLTQLVINAGVGALVAAGLFSIGVPYAALWGTLTVVLRFVPYVGSTLALALPAMLAFAVFPGWRETLLTVGLFLALDALAAYVVEPLVVGHRTGVSSMALLVSAMFWTWLWGPVGLLLSTPVTVCLAVLGKHVPQLAVLGVLFGDEPALETDVSVYQRLLAGDEDEAGEIVERQLETSPLEQVFDGVLVPALVLAGRDRLRNEITEADEEFVVRAVGEIVEDVGGAETAGGGASGAAEAAAGDRPRGHLLAVPARSRADELGLEMLSRLLGPLACEVERLSAAMLAGEVLATAERRRPDLVCVAALPPGGAAHARYLCKRLRARFPTLRIVVARPGAGDDGGGTSARLQAAGADEVATSLTEARDRALRLLQPALVRPAEPAPPAALAAGEAEG